MSSRIDSQNDQHVDASHQSRSSAPNHSTPEHHNGGPVLVQNSAVPVTSSRPHSTPSSPTAPSQPPQTLPMTVPLDASAIPPYPVTFAPPPVPALPPRVGHIPRPASSAVDIRPAPPKLTAHPSHTQDDDAAAGFRARPVQPVESLQSRISSVHPADENPRDEDSAIAGNVLTQMRSGRGRPFAGPVLEMTANPAEYLNEITRPSPAGNLEKRSHPTPSSPVLVGRRSSPTSGADSGTHSGPSPCAQAASSSGGKQKTHETSSTDMNSSHSRSRVRVATDNSFSESVDPGISNGAAAVVAHPVMETRSRRPKSSTGSAKRWAQAADKFRRSVPPVKTYLEERRLVPFRDMRGWIETVASPDCNHLWDDLLSLLNPSDTEDNGDEEICRYILSYIVTDQVDPRNPGVKQTRQAVNNAIKRELDCPGELSLPARGHTFRDLFRTKCRSRRDTDGALAPLPLAPLKSRAPAVHPEASKALGAVSPCLGVPKEALSSLLQPREGAEPGQNSILTTSYDIAVTDVSHVAPSSTAGADQVALGTDVTRLVLPQRPVSKADSLSYLRKCVLHSNQRGIKLSISEACLALADNPGANVTNIKCLIDKVRLLCGPELPSGQVPWWNYFSGGSIDERLQLCGPAEVIAMLCVVRQYHAVFRLLLDFRWLYCHVEHEPGGIISLAVDGFLLLLTNMREDAQGMFDDVDEETIRLLFTALVLIRPCLERNNRDRISPSEFATHLYGRLLGYSCHLAPIAELVRSIRKYASSFAWWYRPLNRAMDEPMTDMAMSVKAIDTTVVAMSPKGSLIATTGGIDAASNTYAIRVWKVSDYYWSDCVLLLEHNSAVTELAISVCDGWIVSSAAGSGDEVLKVWNYAARSKLAANNQDPSRSPARNLSVGDKTLVSSIALMSSRPSVLAALRPRGQPPQSNCFKIWNLETGACEKQIPRHDGWPWRISLSSDDSMLAYVIAQEPDPCSKPNSFGIISVEEGREIAFKSLMDTELSQCDVQCISFLANSSRDLVVGTNDRVSLISPGRVSVWSLEEEMDNGEKRILRHMHTVRDIAFSGRVESLNSPKRDMFVSGNDDGVTRLCILSGIGQANFSYQLLPVGCSAPKRSISGQGGYVPFDGNTRTCVSFERDVAPSVTTSVATSCSDSCVRAVTCASTHGNVYVWDIKEFIENTIPLWQSVYGCSFPYCRDVYGVYDEISNFDFGSSDTSFPSNLADIFEEWRDLSSSGDSLDRIVERASVLYPDNFLSVEFSSNKSRREKRKLELVFDKLHAPRDPSRRTVWAGPFRTHERRSSNFGEHILSPYYVTEKCNSEKRRGLAVLFRDNMVGLFMLEPSSLRISREGGIKRDHGSRSSSDFSDDDSSVAKRPKVEGTVGQA